MYIINRIPIRTMIIPVSVKKHSFYASLVV